MLSRMGFNAIVLDGELRDADRFKFLYGSQVGIRIIVRKSWGRSFYRVDLVIVSRSLMRGKGSLVGAEIFESVEERGGMIMWLFLWCLLCRSWRRRRTDEDTQCDGS